MPTCPICRRFMDARDRFTRSSDESLASNLPRLALTDDGVVEVEGLTVREHGLLDRHWEAVGWYFATGDDGPLGLFDVCRIAGVWLIDTYCVDIWAQSDRPPRGI